MHKRSLSCLVAAALLSAVAGTATARIHRDGDGNIVAMTASRAVGIAEGAGLFRIGDDVTAEVGAWVRAGQGDRRNAAGARPELRLDRRMQAAEGGLVVHYLEQTYRGLPVFGAGERIAVTSTSDGRVLSVNGLFVDPAIELAGLAAPVTADAARRVALDDWPAQRGNAVERPRATLVELVASPAHGEVAWRADVSLGSKALGAVLVSAWDGRVLHRVEQRHEDAFDHSQVSVLALQMTHDPDTSATQMFYNQPASSYGDICWPSPPGTGCDLRMGDDRFAVYDLQRDNASPPAIWTTPQFQAHPTVGGIPYALFTESDQQNYQFLTQNVFVKVHEALEAIDPLQVTRGWDHDPDAPFSLFDEPPLTLMSNVDGTPEGDEQVVCDGALGKFSNYTFDTQWDMVEHPYVSNDYKTAGIVLCSNTEKVAFHEVGHYLDNHNTWGVMGNGVATDSCVADTTDEAPVLAETVAHMTALYAFARLYSGLTYTIDTSASSCHFGPLGTTSSAVHHEDCIDDPDQIVSFNDTRPSHNPASACTVSAGYDQSGVFQAWWKFIYGASCSMAPPYTCLWDIAGEDPDAAMDAMLYALSLSNAQSYVQFFENMAVWIEWQYPERYEVYMDAMVQHDILDPPPLSLDFDSDGIADESDNCIEIANRDQRDSNRDGFGNACDPDFDNDLEVGFGDLNQIKRVFFATPRDPEWDPDLDLDGDDLVNFNDLNVLKLKFFEAPGPSGLVR